MVNTPEMHGVYFNSTIINLNFT